MVKRTLLGYRDSGPKGSRYDALERLPALDGSLATANFREYFFFPRTWLNKKKAAFAAQALWRFSEDEARWTVFSPTNAA